jgi:hypothetical protein
MLMTQETVCVPGSCNPKGDEGGFLLTLLRLLSASLGDCSFGGDKFALSCLFVFETDSCSVVGDQQLNRLRKNFDLCKAVSKTFVLKTRPRHNGGEQGSARLPCK